MYGVLDMAVPHLPADAPKHLLGIGEPDDLLAGIERGIDLFDCAVPTRLARHGMALAPLPEERFRFDVRKAAHAEEEGPLVEGCPCVACRRHSRAYIHHLSRTEELTGVRLLTLHNLSFVERVVAGARSAIEAGSLDGYADRVKAGEPPWDAVPAD
jgi:queuine tRNA-ribosyltransferase